MENKEFCFKGRQTGDKIVNELKENKLMMLHLTPLD